MMPDSSTVLIGRVSGVHGLKGELRIRPYSDEPENLLRYSTLLLAVGEPKNTLVPYKIERARVQKSCAIVKLEACSSRTEAEQLRFALIYVHLNELPELGEDEYYLRDLEGRQVQTEDGQVIGKITGLLLNGAQDILK